MPNLPDFDPYELLGVDASADAVVIDRAYKARIRLVHPDVAGSAGLVETKRLNVAREWLLDPELRARLPKPTRRWRDAPIRTQRRAEPTPESPRRDPHPSWQWDTASRPGTDGVYDPLRHDPLTFDYGAKSEQVRAFLATLRALSDDERARLTYSLGPEPPGSISRYKEQLGELLWGRSRALHDAVLSVWHEREDEIAPFDFPKTPFYGGGPAVANAYAQWTLLGDAIRASGADAAELDRAADACTWPWTASVGQPRYGPNQRGVEAFLHDAKGLSLMSAERLARSWRRHMGRFLYGTPGEDWFPGTLDHPRPDLVSARLAAVDVSRVASPSGLDEELHGAFHSGLRLTVYVLALGGAQDPRHDWLRPWREAMDAAPSFWHRTRYGMPIG